MYSPKLGRFLTPDPIGLAGGINLYSYTSNRPLNRVDPWGLLNILIGVGGSATAPTGVEGSTGIVINPGLGNDIADIGIFGSIGAALGVNVSGDIFVGYIKGGIENVSGITVNTNIVAGPISVTVLIDLNTGEVLGLTVGVGPGVLPVGASGSISATGTFTLRDLIDLIRGDKEKSK